MDRFRGQLIVLFLIPLSGCLKTTVTSIGNSAGNQQLSVVSGNLSFNVSWAANREAAVNKLGGGYKIYYGVQSGFNMSTAPFVDAPYVSGSSAPTTAVISNVAAGTYYVRVVAYSAIAGGSASSPSAESSLTVP